MLLEHVRGHNQYPRLVKPRDSLPWDNAAMAARGRLQSTKNWWTTTPAAVAVATYDDGVFYRIIGCNRLHMLFFLQRTSERTARWSRRVCPLNITDFGETRSREKRVVRERGATIPSRHRTWTDLPLQEKSAAPDKLVELGASALRVEGNPMAAHPPHQSRHDEVNQVLGASERLRGRTPKEVVAEGRHDYRYFSTGVGGRASFESQSPTLLQH